MDVPFNLFDLDPRFFTDPLNIAVRNVPLTAGVPLVYLIENNGYVPTGFSPTQGGPLSSCCPDPCCAYGDPEGLPALWAAAMLQELLLSTDRLPYCYRLRRNLRIAQLTLYVIIAARGACYFYPPCAGNPVITRALNYVSYVWLAKVAAIKILLHNICGDPL